MGRMKERQMEYDLDPADEQQFMCEWQAHQEEIESDAEYHAWLDRMLTTQECEL
jgi:hypothetical protein